LDSIDAEPLSGTEGVQGASLFWSPDSRYIGFVTGGKLKRVEFSGGPVQVICDTPNAEATWNREGTILFASPPAGGGGAGYASGLVRVSEAGGDPVPVTTPNASLKETAHRLPHFLPDGRHFLYLAQSPNAVYAGSLDSKETKRLLTADSAAIYSPPGYLLFVRQGALMAQAFDAQHLELTGEPFRIADAVRTVPNTGRAAFSVSENGTIAYRGGSFDFLEQRLVWLDRNGKRDDSINQTGDSRAPRLSPDEKLVAVQRTDKGSTAPDLWIIDLVRGVNSRLTFGAGTESNAIWSPDGSRIVFRANPTGTYDLYQKLSNGTGNEDVLLKTDQSKSATDWSPDGRFILFSSFDPVTNDDIWVLPLLGDRKPEVFLKTQFFENNARFSPDGQWVAYSSNESGDVQVYIRPFPPAGQKVQVSVKGGSLPQWRRDGKALFFSSGGGQSIMVADIKAGSTIEPGTPREFMKGPFQGSPQVAADGQRLLAPVITGKTGESESTPITVVLNWAAGLKR
jgi:Tol biopolymer transport system component